MNPKDTVPTISIVMPSYQSARFIRQALDSVLSQHYPRLELLVMDGGSRDGTVDILKSMGNRVRWVSEKDEGQANALNKGFRMASGEIVGWLNADDLYETNALMTVGDYFLAHPEAMWAFGPCSIINDKGDEIRKWVTQYKTFRLRRYSYPALLSENFISQMGVFMRRSAILEARGVDESRHYAMDYDLWLKLGRLYRPGYLDQTIGKFRMYDSTKSMTGFHRQFQEDFEVAKKYAAGTWLPIFLHKLNQIKITVLYRLMAGRRTVKR